MIASSFSTNILCETNEIQKWLLDEFDTVYRYNFNNICGLIFCFLNKLQWI